MPTYRSRLFGAWTLEGYDAHDDAGDPFLPLGPEPSGLLVYAEPDRMSAQLMAGGRPRWPKAGVPDRLEAIAGLAESYLAYAGAFEVDEEAGVVSHIPDLSLIPNWVGRPQERHMTFSDDDRALTLSVPGPSPGAPPAYRLAWRRLGGGA